MLSPHFSQISKDDWQRISWTCSLIQAHLTRKHGARYHKQNVSIQLECLQGIHATHHHGKPLKTQVMQDPSASKIRLRHSQEGMTIWLAYYLFHILLDSQSVQTQVDHHFGFLILNSMFRVVHLGHHFPLIENQCHFLNFHVPFPLLKMHSDDLEDPLPNFLHKTFCRWA